MIVTRLISTIKSGSTIEAFDAASELEQMSRVSRGDLYPERQPILELITECNQPGVQWQLAIIASRLPWSGSDVATLLDYFTSWITTSTSAIVKADCLAAICALALEHNDFMPIAKRYLARALTFGSPAEQARARNLIGRVGPAEA